jgi:uncharacterized membrane protein
VIAKCTECGKEYELKEGKKPSDYQCECGGELQHQKPQREKTVTKSSTTSDGHYALFIGILSGVTILVIPGIFIYLILSSIWPNILTIFYAVEVLVFFTVFGVMYRATKISDQKKIEEERMKKEQQEFIRSKLEMARKKE